jgi:16S rRNA (cytosine1402-N4)-methyltransferase
MNNLQFHQPVLLAEMLEALSPKAGEIYVDATFGAGGYSREILKKANSTKIGAANDNCKIYAIDRDPLVSEFSDYLERQYPKNFKFLAGKFSEVTELLLSQGVSEIDGIVFDLGVSSMQFDQKERGFSFDSISRLDMRMDKVSKISAYEVINEFEESEIANIIKKYGEESKARLIAKKIIAERKITKIESCKQLADIARSFYKGYFKTDPATKTFQAIRIFVNQELEELESALDQAKELLKTGGRLVVISFHSLEDSIVKNFLRQQSGLNQGVSRYLPENNNQQIVSFYLTKKSSIAPSPEEVTHNYRARSAKLRFGIKI